MLGDSPSYTPRTNTGLGWQQTGQDTEWRPPPHTDSGFLHQHAHERDPSSIQSWHSRKLVDVLPSERMTRATHLRIWLRRCCLAHETRPIQDQNFSFIFYWTAPGFRNSTLYYLLSKMMWLINALEESWDTWTKPRFWRQVQESGLIYLIACLYCLIQNCNLIQICTTNLN